MICRQSYDKEVTERNESAMSSFAMAFQRDKVRDLMFKSCPEGLAQKAVQLLTN